MCEQYDLTSDFEKRTMQEIYNDNFKYGNDSCRSVDVMDKNGVRLTSLKLVKGYTFIRIGIATYIQFSVTYPDILISILKEYSDCSVNEYDFVFSDGLVVYSSIPRFTWQTFEKLGYFDFACDGGGE